MSPAPVRGGGGNKLRDLCVPPVAVVTADGGRKMSNRAKYAVGGVAVALLLFWFLPNWLALLLVVGVPVAGYFALDSSQRSRLRRIGRKEIDR
jgi:hypothetical protein